MVFGGIKWFGEGGLMVKPEATGLLTENEELFMVSLLYGGCIYLDHGSEYRLSQLMHLHFLYSYLIHPLLKPYY
jgi:hypothetical protein